MEKRRNILHKDDSIAEITIVSIRNKETETDKDPFKPGRSLVRSPPYKDVQMEDSERDADTLTNQSEHANSNTEKLRKARRHD